MAKNGGGFRDFGESGPSSRVFTGRHMAALVVGFFLVVIAVNLVMARFALSTFGGTVVDNSYVAGQQFNGWLEKAEAQKRLGWTAGVERTADGTVMVAAERAGVPLAGALVTGVARHPVGRAPDIALRFEAADDGRYRSDQALPEGRWQVRLRIVRGQDEMRLIETVR